MKLKENGVILTVKALKVLRPEGPVVIRIVVLGRQEGSGREVADTIRSVTVRSDVWNDVSWGSAARAAVGS